MGTTKAKAAIATATEQSGTGDEELDAKNLHHITTSSGMSVSLSRAHLCLRCEGRVQGEEVA